MPPLARERFRSLSKMLPVFFTFLLIIVQQGLDPVWFGIYVIIMSELAAITPPIGVNVYVMAKVAPEVPLMEIFRGILPFFVVACWWLR